MNDYQSQPNFIPNSKSDSNEYTRNADSQVFNITNPQNTYSAFSGPVSNQSNTTLTLTQATNSNGLPTFPNGQIMTQQDINIENKYQMLDSTYEHNTTTSTPITTSKPTNTSTSTSTSTPPNSTSTPPNSTSTPPTSTSILPTSTSTPPTSTPITTIKTKSNFANLGSNSQVISTEQTIAEKIKNDSKNIEKIAIGFITILILIFLIAVIAYIKNVKS
jgi:hypothetical protein